MSWVPAVIGAAGAIGGGLLGSSGASQMDKNARKEAARARDWNKMMSDTAVQRRYEDLQKAGINPLLAAGDPASSPVTSAAPVSNRTKDVADSVREGATTAAQLAQQKDLLESQARKNNADASVTEDAHDATVGIAGATLDKIKSEIDLIANQADQKYWEVARTKLDLTIRKMDKEQLAKIYPMAARKLEAETKQAEAGVPGAQKRAEAWRSVVGTIGAYGEIVVPMVNSALGAGALGTIGKFIKPGTKVKGGLPKHIGTFDKRTGEIFDK